LAGARAARLECGEPARDVRCRVFRRVLLNEGYLHGVIVVRQQGCQDVLRCGHGQITLRTRHAAARIQHDAQAHRPAHAIEDGDGLFRSIFAEAKVCRCEIVDAPFLNGP